MSAIRERRPHLTKEQASKARSEYCTNPKATIEYLADKYEIGRTAMSLIIANKSHHDPDYVNPRKKGGTKQSIYLPDHIKEMKDMLSPAPTTLHRARGHNHVINKFG